MPDRLAVHEDQVVGTPVHRLKSRLPASGHVRQAPEAVQQRHRGDLIALLLVDHQDARAFPISLFLKAMGGDERPGESLVIGGIGFFLVE